MTKWPLLHVDQPVVEDAPLGTDGGFAVSTVGFAREQCHTGVLGKQISQPDHIRLLGMEWQRVQLDRRPELRATPKGMTICGFRLATDRIWIAENGHKQKATSFHRIVAGNTHAEQAAKRLRKGRLVTVIGRLSYRTLRSRTAPRSSSPASSSLMTNAKQPVL
jgi:primosomal replication protein N